MKKTLALEEIDVLRVRLAESRIAKLRAELDLETERQQVALRQIIARVAPGAVHVDFDTGAGQIVATFADDPPLADQEKSRSQERSPKRR